jgi:hypothetical protein
MSVSVKTSVLLRLCRYLAAAAALLRCYRCLATCKVRKPSQVLASQGICLRLFNEQLQGSMHKTRFVTHVQARPSLPLAACCC